MKPTLEAIAPRSRLLQIQIPQPPEQSDVNMLAEMIPGDVDSDVLAAELKVFANILSSGQLTQSGGLDNGEKVIKFVYEHRYALPPTRKSHKLMMTAPITVAKDVQSSQISDHLMILKF